MTPGRLDRPDLLEPHPRVPEVVEDASTVAEQHWNNVELELVQQSRCQVLLSDVAAAPKHDVFAAGGLPCPFERGLDSVCDEVERGPSLHLGIAWVMGDDEHGVVVGAGCRPTSPSAEADQPDNPIAMFFWLMKRAVGVLFDTTGKYTAGQRLMAGGIFCALSAVSSGSAHWQPMRQAGTMEETERRMERQPRRPRPRITVRS